MKVPKLKHVAWASGGLVMVAMLSIVVTQLGAKPKAQTPLPPVVEVALVEQKDVPIYGEWIGTLAGQVNADIKAQVTGYLLTRDYKEGSYVRRGNSCSRLILARFRRRSTRPGASWRRQKHCWSRIKRNLPPQRQTSLRASWMWRSTVPLQGQMPSASKTLTTQTRPISPTKPRCTAPKRPLPLRRLRFRPAKLQSKPLPSTSVSLA
jgi:hypothetical protein